MNNNAMYDESQEPIVISKALIDTLLKTEKPGDCIALYTFYYYTAKWQKTNSVKATTGYTAKGLKWTVPRVRTAKQMLQAAGLVEDYTDKDDAGKIKGHYVKINFIWTESTLRKSQRVDNSETNALSSNKKDIVEQSTTPDILKQVIEYLNAKTFRTFKETSKGHQRHINARLKEGFLFEDFKAVIDFKAEQWLKDETMKSYLRPETLFGNKFDGYLQEAKPQVTFHDRNYANGAIVRVWSDGREEKIREADK